MKARTKDQWFCVAVAMLGLFFYCASFNLSIAYANAISSSEIKGAIHSFIFGTLNLGVPFFLTLYFGYVRSGTLWIKLFLIFQSFVLVDDTLSMVGILQEVWLQLNLSSIAAWKHYMLSIGFNISEIVFWVYTFKLHNHNKRLQHARTDQIKMA